MNRYRVGIIGAGLQAKRRIPAINQLENSKVISITSNTLISSQKLAKEYGLRVCQNWREITRNKEIDIVIVSTYPNSHAEITIDALKNGKHVLCEKPLAQTIIRDIQS